MRCPQCVEEERLSRLNHQKLHPTGPVDHVERYWDETGNLHVHDHTIYRDMFSCTNDHTNLVETHSRCPQPGCDWNKPGNLHVSGRGPVRA